MKTIIVLTTDGFAEFIHKFRGLLMEAPLHEMKRRKFHEVYAEYHVLGWEATVTSPAFEKWLSTINHVRITLSSEGQPIVEYTSRDSYGEEPEFAKVSNHIGFVNEFFPNCTNSMPCATFNTGRAKGTLYSLIEEYCIPYTA